MKIIKKILDNGLIIVLIPMKSTNIITTGFFVGAGAIDETVKTKGIAHFLEHLMFGGTKSRPSEEIFKQLDSVGATYNAVTTMENTYYYISGNSVDTKKILDIALDIYINPTFTKKAINKEKKVIIEEMRMRFDTPYVKLYEALHSKIFKSTPLSGNIIGTEETINSFNRKDFVKFRTDTYRPDKTVFVVTGNMNPAIIYKIIAKPLGRLVNPPIPHENYILSTNLSTNLSNLSNLSTVTDIGGENNFINNPSTEITFDIIPQTTKDIIYKNMAEQTVPYVYLKQNNSIQQVYLLMAFPLFDIYDKHSKEVDMLSNVLTAGLSSRLNNALRFKKGITYSSTSYPYTYSDGGVFMIQTTMHPQGFIPGLKIILAELRKLKKNPIDTAELKKVKKITTNEILFMSTDPVDQLTYYGLGFLKNHNFKPDRKKSLEKIKRVTAKNIQMIANKIFSTSKLNLYLYGNVETHDFDFIKV